MSVKPSSNQPQASASGSAPIDASHPMSTVINGGTGRILCVSDIRGDYNNLNRMVEETKAVAVIHTGDFGFLDGESPSRMLPRISRHLLSYTPLLDNTTRSELLAIPHGPDLFSRLDPEPSSPSSFKLSQLGLLLSGEIKLACPVYTVYGPVEDVRVLEKFRTGEYEVDNLMILDEALTRSLEVGGIKLRLFGLGGGVQMHRIFDNGEGTATIAGGNGTIWATALQIGELVDTAERVFDPSETRLLVTHGAYGKDGLLAQLAMVLKADLTISGALHFRFISSFNEFGVHSDQESFRNKLLKSKNAFMDVYESAKVQLDSSISADQKEFLQKAVQVAQKVPGGKADEEDPYWKNCWHWSLSEAAFGHMVLSVKEGRVSSETFSQGLNFGYRRYQKAGRQVEAPAQTQTNTGTNTPVQMNAQNKSVNAPMGPASQNRQPAQPRKVNSGNTVENKPAPAQTSSTPGPTKPSTPAPAPTVNPPPNVAPAQTKPTPTVQAKQAEGPIPSSTSSAPIPQQSQQQQQQQQQSSQQQNGRQERKTSNRFEKGEVKDREQRERGPERERENPWTKANGGEATERPGKKLRGPKPMKDTKETTGSSTDGFKPVNAKKELAIKSETTSKPDSDKENAAESTEPAEDAKKPEAEDGPSRINGDRPPRTPLNPYTLYIKGLPADVTQDSLKTIFDEAIRAKITRMKIPLDPAGKAKHFAYVEFSNDEDLQAALNKHEDALNGSSLNITISNPPATSSFRGGRGGFNGSRGGRGGGFGGRGGFRPGFNKSAAPSS